MDNLILQEIKGQLYCLYLHGIICSEQHMVFMERLYKFYNSNDGFSYVDAIKYIFGGD